MEDAAIERRAGSDQQSAGESSHYAAFISYRHGGEDERIARLLHRQIEHYRVPRKVMARRKVPRRLGRLFRDDDELPTSGSLTGQIETALEQSQSLIVICSPRLPLSKWCRREIHLFRKLHPGAPVLAVLIAGDPSKQGTEEDPFPAELRFENAKVPRSKIGVGEGASDGAPRFVTDEPLAAELRPVGGRVPRGVHERALLKIIAGIVGCSFDDLYDRHRRRARRWTAGLTSLAVSLLIGSVVIGATIVRSRRVARDSTRAAGESAIVADQSKKLATAQVQQRRWTQYLTDVSQLDDLWKRNDVIKARQLLDRQIPVAGNAASDLRGPEWYLWDRLLRLASRELDAGEAIRCLAFGRNDTRLAATSPYAVTVWDLTTNQVERKLEILPAHPQHNQALLNRPFDESVAFSPDGKLLAATGFFDTGKRVIAALRVWDADSGEERLAIPDDSRLGGRAVTFSPDGRWVIGGGWNTGWVAWNIATQAVIEGRRPPSVGGVEFGAPLSRVKDQVIDVHFNAGVLFTSGDGAPPRFWSWPDGLEREPLNYRPHWWRQGGYVLDPQQFTLVRLKDHSLQIASPSRGPSMDEDERMLDTAHRDISCVWVRNNTLVAGCSDGLVLLYDLANGRPLATEFHGEAQGINSVAFGSHSIAAATIHEKIRIWNRSLPDYRESIELPKPVARTTDRVAGETISPSGRYVCRWAASDPRAVIQTSAGETVGEVPVSAGGVLRCQFSPHEQFAVLFLGSPRPATPGRRAGGPNFLIWDLQHGREVPPTPELLSLPILRSASFSTNEDLVALANSKEGACVIRTSDGQCVARISGLYVVDVVISPLGGFLGISGAGADDASGVFDLTRSAWVFRFQNGGTFSFDAREERVAVVNSLTGIEIRELRSGRTLPTAFGRSQFSQFILAADGQRAYAVSGDLIHVFAVETGALLASFTCRNTPEDSSQLESMLIARLKGLDAEEKKVLGPASTNAAAAPARVSRAKPATQVVAQRPVMAAANDGASTARPNVEQTPPASIPANSGRSVAVSKPATQPARAKGGAARQRMLKALADIQGSQKTFIANHANSRDSNGHTLPELFKGAEKASASLVDDQGLVNKKGVMAFRASLLQIDEYLKEMAATNQGRLPAIERMQTTVKQLEDDFRRQPAFAVE